MKTLPAGMQAHLDTFATSLCYCWKLTRAGGPVLGFTDHDRALVFDGVTFGAVSGFEASAIDTALGLNVDGLDVLGALNATSLNEADLAAGRFDNAPIEIYRVNWQDVSQRILLRKGNLGEVSRRGSEFRAEVRGLAHTLNQPGGRLYQYGCDVDLGSAKCTVNLNAAANKGSGIVAAPVTGEAYRAFTASGLGGFANDWFTRGKLSWSSGANAGLPMEVKLHTLSASIVSIELWQAMPELIAAGNGFDITAGCDKQFSTCKAKFNNAINFRGFHRMPGNDWVQSYPSQGELSDGGLLA